MSSPFKLLLTNINNLWNDLNNYPLQESTTEIMLEKILKKLEDAEEDAEEDEKKTNKMYKALARRTDGWKSKMSETNREKFKQWKASWYCWRPAWNKYKEGLLYYYQLNSFGVLLWKYYHINLRNVLG